jgi:uncharacterized damage-inducible protein DinB
MRTGDIVRLYDYNYWANDRILRATENVSPELFTAPFNLSHGSLRRTLVHALGAEALWRLRCQEGISPSALLSESEVPTLESIRARWKDEERAMRSFLASLTDDALDGRVQYRSTKGVPFENVLWHLLVHVVNHGTQTRAEAGVALTEYGHSPGDIDLLAFLREREQ